MSNYYNHLLKPKKSKLIIKNYIFLNIKHSITLAGLLALHDTQNIYWNFQKILSNISNIVPNKKYILQKKKKICMFILLENTLECDNLRKGQGGSTEVNYKSILKIFQIFFKET
jgi:hypothetical protein